MAMVRRYWALFLAVAIFVAAVVLVVFPRSRVAQTAFAEDPLPALSAHQPLTGQSNPIVDQVWIRTYGDIQRLRFELALTTSDLAALGVSPNVAMQILGAVKGFVAADGLAAADTSCRSAHIALQQAVRQINMGTSDSSVLASLPSLRSNVAAAVGARASVLASLVNQVNGLLNSDQQNMWQAARSNAISEWTPGRRGAPGEFRYVVGLTGAQIDQLNRTMRNGGAPALVASAPQLLDASQIVQAQNAMQNQRVAIKGVILAESAAFPLPNELEGKTPATTQPASVNVPGL